jgi:nickel-dependent lactate racemase
MHIQLAYGMKQLELELSPSALVLPAQENLPPAEGDPTGVVRNALETPLGFPALRRALTPDDHVAIVVDEQLQQPARLLVPIIEHVESAHVPLEAITLVCPPSDRAQDWIDDFPEQLLDVRLEAHAPQERRQLSYVATMKSGRRLYLNRTVADADQTVVLSGTGGRADGFDAAALLFPALSDDATRHELLQSLPVRTHDKSPRSEIQEAIWLFGAPFFVQVVEGLGDTIAAVVAGMFETSERAHELAAARWSIPAQEPVRTVVAAVSGSHAGQDMGALARAAATAARLVQQGGRIVLLTDARPTFSEAFEMLRESDDPEESMALLRKNQPAGRGDAQAWAAAAGHARIFLLSGLPADTVEELHAAPLENERQVGRLVVSEESCIVLRDAHKVNLPY